VDSADRDLERELCQAARAAVAPWLDQRRPDVVCLQATELAADAFAELLGDELARRLRVRPPPQGWDQRRG